MTADEDNLTWTFTDGYGCKESVDICTDSTMDKAVVITNDIFLVDDVPKLIKALQAAYDFHMEAVK